MAFTISKLYKLLISVLLVIGLSSQVIAQPVAFSYRAPEAHQVTMIYSIDNWQKHHLLKQDKDGLWIIKLDIPKGHIEFLFKIDGQLRINPLTSSISDGFGGKNNILIIE